jgi:hypothetical protein
MIINNLNLVESFHYQSCLINVNIYVHIYIFLKKLFVANSLNTI